MLRECLLAVFLIVVGSKQALSKKILVGLLVPIPILPVPSTMVNLSVPPDADPSFIWKL